MFRSKHMHARKRSLVSAGAMGAVAVLAFAACSSKTTTAGTTSSSPTTSTSPPASASPSAAAVASSPPTTIMTASIGTVGTVLVNASGMTLYELSSEKGAKLTCTAANGCASVWPATELAAGATAAVAGTGAQASLLGTVKTADGKLHVTYNSFPVYTFVGDTTTGTANGQGKVSFGGTWTAITPAGAPAALTAAKTAPAATMPATTAPATPAATTAPATTAPPTPTPSASSSNPYGY